MQKIKTDGGVFVAGNPATSTKGTVVTAAWLQAVQDELVAAVEELGLTLDDEDNSQLAQILKTLGGAAESELTIGAGSITPTTSSHNVDTEADAASDDLTNIATTNIPDGRFLFLRANNTGRTVVIKHAATGAGQIHLANAADRSLDNTEKHILLQRRGADLYEVSLTAVFAAIIGGTIDGVDIGITTPGKINIAAGTVALPGAYFAGEIGTGISRPAANTLVASINGVEALRLDSNANLGLNITPDDWYSTYTGFNVGGNASIAGITAVGASGALSCSQNAYLDASANWVRKSAAVATRYAQSSGEHSFLVAATGTAGSIISWTTAMAIGNAGNMGIGVTPGVGNSLLVKAAAGDTNILQTLVSGGAAGLFVPNVSSTLSGENAADACVKVRKDSVTGRSINAAGTINAAGADCAEYETKADNDQIISKGDIVGFNDHGQLTTVFADAHRFQIKSTNPHVVGGDVWGNEEALGMETPEYVEPEYTGIDCPTKPTEPIITLPPEPVQQPDETDETFAVRYAQWQQQCSELQATYDADMIEYETSLSLYTDELAVYTNELDAYNALVTEAKDIYNIALSEFRAILEDARQTVDRIAYSGKVPVNISATVADVGSYIVPVDNGSGGITGEIISNDAITFDQYRRAVGIIHRVEVDGRPVVAVKVG